MRVARMAGKSANERKVYNEVSVGNVGVENNPESVKAKWHRQWQGKYKKLRVFVSRGRMDEREGVTVLKFRPEMRYRLSKEVDRNRKSAVDYKLAKVVRV